MKAQKIILFISLFCFLLGSQRSIGQDSIVQKFNREYLYYKDYDYLSHDYKYLDESYQIQISSQVFEKMVTEYKFNRDQITGYRDSIKVIMYAEFDNDTQARIAGLHLGFSYLRLSYYLWLSPEETADLCEQYNFTHPYRLYEYVRDESKWDDKMRKFMANHRALVASHTKNPDVIGMEQKAFLNLALRESPQRIGDYTANHTNEEGKCNAENCCQGNAKTADTSKCTKGKDQ